MLAMGLMELPLETHRRALFGLCYRMTGSAADAEDLVQQTFERALARPPADREAPLRPWLLKVATNLSVDALRRRKRERYLGPWLPEPIDTDRVADDLDPGPEARVGTLESATFAFLLALEALDERQRAVLVLSDVLGLSGPEVGAALELSPGNVRVILHRARMALAEAAPHREAPSPELRARTAAALRELLVALATGNAERVCAMLTDDAVSVNDSGGEFTAAVVPLRGPGRIAAFYAMIRTHHPALPRWMAERDVNGLPAYAVDLGPQEGARYARRSLFTLELAPDGRVAAIRVFVASAKLAAMRFPKE